MKHALAAFALIGFLAAAVLAEPATQPATQPSTQPAAAVRVLLLPFGEISDADEVVVTVI